jgi:predicted transcriptional regulator
MYAINAIGYTINGGSIYPMAKRVTTRLDDDYVDRIDKLAARRGVDRSALLRSFLLYALKENTIRDSLEEYSLGEKTLWEVAESCDLSLWEIIHEARIRHIHSSYDLKELEKDLSGPDE